MQTVVKNQDQVESEGQSPLAPDGIAVLHFIPRSQAIPFPAPCNVVIDGKAVNGTQKPEIVTCPECLKWLRDRESKTGALPLLHFVKCIHEMQNEIEVLMFDTTACGEKVKLDKGEKVENKYRTNPNEVTCPKCRELLHKKQVDEFAANADETIADEAIDQLINVRAEQLDELKKITALMRDCVELLKGIELAIQARNGLN